MRQGHQTPRDERVENPSAGHKRLRLLLVIGAALIVGVIGRSLVADHVTSSFVSDLLPWLSGTSITLYFGDASERYLVPVSRTLTGKEETPSGLVEALLNGPDDGAGLKNFIPAGTVAHSVSIEEATLHVDLSSEYQDIGSPLRHEALIQSLMSWPGIEEVQVTVDEEPLDTVRSSGHLLYFYDRTLDMLVAVPTADQSPQDVLSAYLAGPEETHLIGMPDDVRVLSLESALGSGLLVLNLTYSPSVREFAIEDGDAMRRVLEGLIATLTTGFPQTNFVFIDFEGQATLGLGQCANLLRRVQPQPEILNDERLLSLHTGA
jgi:spore germination protein GerM